MQEPTLRHTIPVNESATKDFIKIYQDTEDEDILL